MWTRLFFVEAFDGVAEAPVGRTRGPPAAAQFEAGAAGAAPAAGAAAAADAPPITASLAEALTVEPSGAIRVGYTCSKKLGNAVARNRAKRRLKEARSFGNVARLDACVCQRLLARIERALDQIFDKLFKIGAADCLDEVLGPRRVGGDEGQADLGLGHRAELDFRLLGRLEQHRLLEISPQAARQRVALPLELALLLCRQFGANQSVEGELAAI